MTDDEIDEAVAILETVMASSGAPSGSGDRG